MFDVFVISPYTDINPDITQARVAAADLYIGKLTQQGIVAYSAISAMHHLLDSWKLPNDWKYWEKHCATMIGCAKIVHVLCLDGWDTSVGVAGEIAIARELKKPVIEINEFKDYIA